MGFPVVLGRESNNCPMDSGTKMPDAGKNVPGSGKNVPGDGKNVPERKKDAPKRFEGAGGCQLLKDSTSNEVGRKDRPYSGK
jgi:hypothetical protein